MKKWRRQVCSIRSLKRDSSVLTNLSFRLLSCFLLLQDLAPGPLTHRNRFTDGEEMQASEARGNAIVLSSFRT